VFWRDQSPLRK